MIVIKEYNSNELMFDNVERTSNIKKININGETIEINYNSIIDTQFTGGNTGQKFEQLKEILNLGIYSKAPCGGFINFYKISGSSGNDYIIYSGVNEVSNSHYIITIHKILKD
jgi:hypothetical protein